jgi:hypothetical protein
MDASAQPQRPATSSEVIDRLNSHQRMTLKEIEQLGWWLVSIGFPAYPEPAIAVVCDTGCPIGLLDPLGKIVPDVTLKSSTVNPHSTGEEADPLQDRMEKRGKSVPIPDDLNACMNRDQRHMLQQLQNFGWHIKFVRRPLFEQPIIILVSGDGNQVGVLERDGRLNLHGNITLRSG